MIFAEMIVIQYHTNCGWKRRYWSRIVCAITIATVAPLHLQTTAKVEQIKWCW